MKPPEPSGQRGLTLLEVLVVIAILVIFIAGGIGSGVATPADKAKANRISCLNNLKNIELALRIFSADHGDAFPMALSITNGGTREWLSDETQLWRHWRALSNELSSTKILLCPSDLERQLPKSFTDNRPVLSWGQFTNNSHLSYFLDVNLNEDEPQSILAGDRNLTTNGGLVGPGRLVLSPNLLLGFTDKIHRLAGNVLLADGSVQRVSSPQLVGAWSSPQTNSGPATNIWLVP